LDFSGRKAGTLGFDWAGVANSTGNRASSLRVYTSTNGTDWTELTEAAVLNVSNNVAASGSKTAIALPSSFDTNAAARLRFYECNGTGGSTGSRAKIAIDNVAVTSTSAGVGVGPRITAEPQSLTNWSPSTATLTVTAVGDPTLRYTWQSNYLGTFFDLSNGGQISGADTNTLTITTVGPANAGEYRVIVTNDTSSATSQVATLTVTNLLPQIDKDIQSLSVVLGTPVLLHIAASIPASGAPAPTYQWRSNDVDMADSGQITGTATGTLAIPSVNYSNQADYRVVVSDSSGSVTGQVATLTVTTSGLVAKWNFNDTFNISSPPTNSPAPSFGTGTAAAVNLGRTFVLWPPYQDNTDTESSTNGAWGTSNYPTNGPSGGVSNKQAGVRFNVSTVGLKNVTVAYDIRVTSTASRYERLQFTTNGNDFIDFPTSSPINPGVVTPTAIFDSRSFSLAGFPGVRDNANFGIRIVTEIESTATYGVSANTNYVPATGASYDANNGSISYDLVKISADAITSANLPPTVSTIANVTVLDSDGPTNVTFTVGDDSGLSLLTVTASSSNPSVGYPVVNPGTGASRSLTLTPSLGNTGAAVIQVTVTDGDGDVATTWFNFTVNAGNEAPTVTPPANTNMLANTVLALDFPIGDDHTPVNTLSASAFSGNTSLVPNDPLNLSVTTSGATRTITITPAAGATGVVPITLTVTDDGSPVGVIKSTTARFAVMVRPGTNIVLNDSFAYDEVGPLITNSVQVWQNHSGSPVGGLTAGLGWATVTSAQGEDVNALLLGGPYAQTGTATLYSSFTLNYSTLPSEGGAYFAHFKDSGSGFGARVYASTLNAAAGKYRVGIGNGGGVTNTTAQFPVDLSTSSNYTIVTRYAPSNGVATLWVNPTGEKSASVTDMVTSPYLLNVVAYAFREAAEEGTLMAGNLKVGTSFAAVALPSPNLNVLISDGNAVVSWANQPNATFSLEGATSVGGPYLRIPDATNPYNIPITSVTNFFRLVWP
jgi:hypothetical protein